mmetsp:Transcript_44426/g.128406  ORF Transcript_44426/g.128406 Transcript_44426/m.128406 type:complete len:216 (+) Transcript_44426:129-776(+)
MALTLEVEQREAECGGALADVRCLEPMYLVDDGYGAVAILHGRDHERGSLTGSPAYAATESTPGRMGQSSDDADDFAGRVKGRRCRPSKSKRIRSKHRETRGRSRGRPRSLRCGRHPVPGASRAERSGGAGAPISSRCCRWVSSGSTASTHEPHGVLRASSSPHRGPLTALGPRLANVVCERPRPPTPTSPLPHAGGPLPAQQQSALLPAKPQDA